jgi:signal transduction histidine kinase
MPIANLLIVLGMLTIAFVILIVRYRELLRDVNMLKHAFVMMLRQQPLPNKFYFSSKVINNLWHSVQLLCSQLKTVERTTHIADDVLKLSSSIASAADDLPKAIENVVNIILERGRPEVIAIAVITKNSTTSELCLNHLRGLPKKRIEEPLLTHFEELIDNSYNHLSSSWGYASNDQSTNYNFSTFGVGLTFTVPLYTSEGLSGGFWIALRHGSRSFDINRQKFIEILSTYAACSLGAAIKVKQQNDQKELEKDFLLGLSHDLRAPGNSALYALHLLLDDRSTKNLTNEQLRCLQLVKNGITDQNSLISDILDFAKFKKQLLKASTAIIRLGAVLDEILPLYKAELERKNLLLVSNYDKELLISVDSKHFKRIISNLLSNAIKFTNSGSLSIISSVQFSKATVSIVDTGSGVPPSKQNLLFRQFSRCDETIEDGMGFGLSFCQMLTGLNSGSLTYQPNVPNGSIFSLSLPLGTEETLAANVNIITNVLIVDDDELTWRLHKKYFSAIAEHIIYAKGVEEAKNIISTQKLDLIVTDYFLEDGTASDLFNQSNVETPVIVVTGSALIDKIESNIKSKNIYFIEKPIAKDCLYAALEQLNLH